VLPPVGPGLYVAFGPYRPDIAPGGSPPGKGLSMYIGGGVVLLIIIIILLVILF
jgi:hypothetical protein